MEAGVEEKGGAVEDEERVGRGGADEGPDWRGEGNRVGTVGMGCDGGDRSRIDP